MGVPVLTLAGSTHAARVGVSLLTSVGCPELIAGTITDYVTIAADLAGNLGRLRFYRENLRAIMAVSSLMDAARLTKELEKAYSAILTCGCSVKQYW